MKQIQYIIVKDHREDIKYLFCSPSKDEKTTAENSFYWTDDREKAMAFSPEIAYKIAKNLHDWSRNTIKTEGKIYTFTCIPHIEEEENKEKEKKSRMTENERSIMGYPGLLKL